MINNLLLLSGNDIPFEEAQLVIHPPTIKEIAYIGEESFWNGVEFLNFSKDLLSSEDKNNLSAKTDFEVLLSVIQSQNAAIKIQKTQMELVLALMFPEYRIFFTPSAISFRKEEEKNLLLIDNKNFEIFKKSIIAIFCLDEIMNKNGSRVYNPSNSVAENLVNKFKERRKKLAKIKKDQGEETGLNILSNYVSILAIGAGHDINTLMNYTVFQLIDEFKRYQLKTEFDINIQAKMAGAKDLKEAENWMKTLHSNNSN